MPPYKLLVFIVSPLGMLFLCFFVAFFLFWFGKRVFALILICLSMGCFWICATPLFADWIAYKVEKKWIDVLLPNRPADIIVVLGGAISPPVDKSKPADFGPAVDRVFYAFELYKMGFAPRVLVSGGGTPRSALPEAFYMKQLLVKLGVPEELVVVESKSQNTKENAAFSNELLKKMSVSTIVLVTSAFHMERAVAEFENLEIVVQPAPTDFLNGLDRGAYCLLPDVGSLDISTKMFKELLGTAHVH